MAQGSQIVDRYHNTTRDGMPLDETITSFADRLVELAEKVILEQGGERVLVQGRPVCASSRAAVSSRPHPPWPMAAELA